MLSDNQDCRWRLGEGSPQGVGGTSADCSDADMPRPDWQLMVSKVTATGDGGGAGRKTSVAAAAPSLLFTCNGLLTGSDCLLQACPPHNFLFPVTWQNINYLTWKWRKSKNQELVNNHSFHLWAASREICGTWLVRSFPDFWDCCSCQNIYNKVHVGIWLPEMSYYESVPLKRSVYSAHQFMALLVDESCIFPGSHLTGSDVLHLYLSIFLRIQQPLVNINSAAMFKGTGSVAVPVNPDVPAPF